MSIEIEEDELPTETPLLSLNASTKKRTAKQPASILKSCMTPVQHIYEIGVDEAGRGPLFGRVYAGAVILPKDNTFDHSLMKDSKKFHSKKKICEAADYIKDHSIAWAVAYESEQVIDDINILQATQQTMHKAITRVIAQLENKLLGKDKDKDKEDNKLEIQLLIDGNYFKPYVIKNSRVPFETVEQGDNTYSSIAAASILAKVARDQYIEELCEEHPDLSEKYGIDSNKGYGAKKHMDGIKEHGITVWHRRTFGICKQY